MFRPMDLVAPIGVSLVAVVLCVWGMIAAPETAAKVVCAITGVAFLSTIPLLYIMRWISRRCDFTTKHGMRVRLGRRNKPTKEAVEFWTDWVINWWGDKFSSHASDVPRALGDKLLVFVDQTKISVLGRWVRGYNWYSTVVVGWNGSAAYTESLVKHELSHWAAVACNHPMDEAKHHALFKSLKLGH